MFTSGDGCIYGYMVPSNRISGPVISRANSGDQSGARVMFDQSGNRISTDQFGNRIALDQSGSRDSLVNQSGLRIEPVYNRSSSDQYSSRPGADSIEFIR